MHKLIVFDLDNTLTKSKLPVDEEMSELFNKLIEIKKVAVISGGSFKQLEKELLFSLKLGPNLSNLHIFPTDGTAYFTWDNNEGKWQKIYQESLTEKDKEDLLFGIANDIDYVALSFVRTADDIRHIREIIIANIDKKKRLPIIAKIEKGEALQNIDEIIEEADAVMVARGDLGVECSTEDVPLAQKMICKKANAAGKPVIIATQMLESMIENPRPTRAEANDVANAVLDGADAVMLSGETSVGKNVIKVVETMNTIIRKVEETRQDHLSLDDDDSDKQLAIFKAIGRSACVLAKQINAAAIIPITHSGTTAKIISKYRPSAKIIAVTDRERIQRRLNLIWGVRSIVIPKIENTDTTLEKIQQELVKEGYVKPGDYVVTTAGIPLLSRNSTNMVKVEKIM